MNRQSSVLIRLRSLVRAQNGPLLYLKVEEMVGLAVVSSAVLTVFFKDVPIVKITIVFVTSLMDFFLNASLKT